MRITPSRNQNFLEVDMQESVANYFSKRKFQPSDSMERRYGRSWIIPKIYREIRIPNIGRISDIIIYITDRRIINIECKATNYWEVARQAKDHLEWADYSYVCFWSDTYLPNDVIQFLLDNGIGLILWNENALMEVIQSNHNKKINKHLREHVVSILKKKNAVKTGGLESEMQLTVGYESPQEITK